MTENKKENKEEESLSAETGGKTMPQIAAQISTTRSKVFSAKAVFPPAAAPINEFANLMDKPVESGALSKWELDTCENFLRLPVNPEALTSNQRERLKSFADYLINDSENQNFFEAKKIFLLLQDFKGLNKLCTRYLNEDPESGDLITILILLEKNQDLKNILNLKSVLQIQWALHDLTIKIYGYINEYLAKNGTLATGKSNEGIDLVAIRNLSEQYDLAVPIARGGLNQGSIADFWGMPTKIVDIGAHDRKVAKGKWVSPVTPEDFRGKHILLFDKDTVSGATIQKAVKMLLPFKPASIGVYFAYDPKENETGFAARLKNIYADIKIHYPNNAPMQNAGDIYFEANEKFRTLTGRRSSIEKQFRSLLPKLQKDCPDLAKPLKDYVSRHFSKYDSLNPLLTGINEVKSRILTRLESLYKEFITYLGQGVFAYANIEYFKHALNSGKALPEDIADILIRERYKEQSEDAAGKRRIDNPHIPSDPDLAFQAAIKAVRHGYDAAIVVGPEGFAYEPYFNDLGLQTVAVNIPESEPGGPRSLQIIDKLESLKGKKVLVIEDDIRTGATLEKVLEAIKENMPAELGLYLGQPPKYQLKKNIPKVFKKVFTAGEKTTSKSAQKTFIDFLKSRNLNLHKK